MTTAAPSESSIPSNSPNLVTCDNRNSKLQQREEIKLSKTLHRPARLSVRSYLIPYHNNTELARPISQSKWGRRSLANSRYVQSCCARARVPITPLRLAILLANQLPGLLPRCNLTCVQCMYLANTFSAMALCWWRFNTDMVTQLLSNSHNQTGPWGGCKLEGIPLSGGRQLGNLGSILLCAIAILVSVLLLLLSERKKAAVGRR